ncbi:MAG: hypothetical protein WBB67_12140 [bacterium]
MNNQEFLKSWFDVKVKNKQVRRHRYGHLYADEDAVYSYGDHFPLAMPCDNGFLLNGDRYSSTTSSHQSLTRSVCLDACKDNNLRFAVIPFTVLNNADLTPVKQIEIIDKIEENYRDVEYTDKDGTKKVRHEHLLGGSVIRYSNRCLLSSNDPTATWGNGYFLTELTEPLTTVEDALESLKPHLVKQFESTMENRKAPLDSILRHGEWFFIKMDQKSFIKSVKCNKGIRTMDKIIMRHEYLPSGDSSRPHHRATRMIYIGNDLETLFDREKNQDARYRITYGFYCRGTVRHDNRQHRMLKLGNGREWYLAVRNRQIRSWSYDGRVD